MENDERSADLTIETFTSALLSDAPAPGGGGAAAYVAAAGIALGGMVGALTTGKKAYADVEEDITKLIARAKELRVRFLQMIDEDAEAFLPLAKAYGIPKDDPSRDEIMEKALTTAAEAPLALMESCREALDVTEEFAKKGSRLALSDAGCAAVFLRAAMEAASFNVAINTKAMKNRDAVAELDGRSGTLLNEGREQAKRICDTVLSVIS